MDTTNVKSVNPILTIAVLEKLASQQSHCLPTKKKIIILPSSEFLVQVELLFATFRYEIILVPLELFFLDKLNLNNQIKSLIGVSDLTRNLKSE